MRINILTSGRFHVLDLARELDTFGHQVAFYSCVPSFRTENFGLPGHCNKALLWVLAPLLFYVQKCKNRPRREKAEHILNKAIDFLASHFAIQCDVFIGMSGMSARTAMAMRRKYGAQIWIERGSRHILSQKEILEAIPFSVHNNDGVSKSTILKELRDYEIADRIVIPSKHVERSFLERGIAHDKLFRNAYGVDLSMFSPTSKPINNPPIVLFVGRWSMRKGCDVLWEACQASKSWRLLHVGPIGDAPVPNSPLFIHRDTLPQWRLVEEFGKADVFVLASREEGLSLVQAQALACGLPVVCTDRTGGADLRDQLSFPEWITVVPNNDAISLAIGIRQALSLSNKQSGVRDILGDSRFNFAWSSYGKRYSDELAKIKFANK